MATYQGLSDQEVKENQERYGPNLLTPAKRKAWWRLFIEKFDDPIIKILLIAAAISLSTGFLGHETLEGFGILVAIFLATFMAFLNEFRASKEFDLLNKINDEDPYTVKRGGQLIAISKKEITVGDLLLLESGQEVPSDAELLIAEGFSVDQSSLTGESNTVNKRPFDSGKEEESAYAYYKVFKGTLVSTGHASVKVTAIGDEAEIGKTAQLASEEIDQQSPLKKQLGALSIVIGRVGMAVSVFLFLSLLLRALLGGEIGSNHSTLHNVNELIDLFMIAVALIVVAVPEGLPMSVTLTLAYSVRKMMKNNILVRHMEACETIGAATVICTDKTGTLTMNQMRVAQLVFPEVVDEDLINYSFAVNSSGNLAISDSAPSVLGNPTEGALLLYLYERGINYDELRHKFVLKEQKPFSTDHKYMASYGLLADKKIVFIKGAPEIILEKAESFSMHDKKYWYDTIMAQQQLARRVLGLAVIYPGDDKADLDSLANLHWLGLVAIADPLRSDVPKAIQQCLDAGIDIKMITGDSKPTAISICKQLGGLDCSDSRAICGNELAALSDEELKQYVGSLTVMARSRPEDKLRLVKALQQQNHVVAVTGDGTNDAPALNYANVGLSMGITGTAIAKEASDIILTDDSFSSIVQSIIWGRSLYISIQRFILFQLTVNITAVVIAVIGPFIGISLPFTVLQMLWVNLIMDTFAALALATEGADQSVMQHKPRPVDAFIINKAMARQLFIGSFFMLLLFMSYLIVFRKNMNLTHQSLFFNVFVLIQFWNLYNVRFFQRQFTFRAFLSNRSFHLIAIVILGGQYLINLVGYNYFRTMPLSLISYLKLVGATSLFFLLPMIWRLIKQTLSLLKINFKKHRIL